MAEDRLSKTKTTPNEDVIDELTKNLESSFVEKQNHDEFVINPNFSQEDVPSSSGDYSNIENTNTESDFKDDFDKDEKADQSDRESEMDEIDEEQLKDAEIDLTDDQKAERKIIAEELKTMGNNAFKDGEYELSIEKYTEGLKICPLQFTKQRSILYCNRSASKMKLKKFDKAIKDCTKAIELDEEYLKAYIRRAQSYEATEKLDESLADYNKILQLDPLHKEAKAATIRLPPLIEEKNEKLKTEMLGKLKDLGNMILKPFGLSTENFQLEQDPESKGYKINFKQ